MLTEICANSYQSALYAALAGAKRIELCSELSLGGITPSFGLLKQVTETLKISVFVLIRPRSGNFVYSDDEFEIMKKNIKLCKELGCHGIVSGVLKNDNTIDIKRTQELLEISKPLSFTFHRAFDNVPNPFEALDQLINLGVDRVLSSGQEVSAEKGIELLKELKEKSNNRVIILPGSGINSKNVSKFYVNGFKEIHASATTINQIQGNSKVLMNSSKFFNETIEVFSDVQKIKAILNAVIDEK